MELSKQARLEARLPHETHALLKRAAEIEGRSLTDFVVAAASAAARQTIAETEIIRLSRESAEAFLDALENPPKPAAAMKRAAKHHKQLISSQ